jgi:peptide/nickel transport system permease protein
MQATRLTDQQIQASTWRRRAQGRGRSLLAPLVSNPKFATGIGIMLWFVLLSTVGTLLIPYNPDASVVTGSLAPSAAHPLGTTGLGQDMLAQIAYGSRVSLLTGFIAAAGSTALQVIFGLSSAYFGGLVDEMLSLVINVFLVLPGLPLAIVVASLADTGVGRSEFVLALILLFTSWSYGARVLRSQTLSLKEREFVAAARASGESALRIIFVEILPNEIALVASTFIGTFVYAVGAQVGLDFLGLGDTSHASWGEVLFWAQSNGALIVGKWWQFVPAGLCVAILCAGLTFINFGIDELANPRLRSERPLRKLMTARMRALTQRKENPKVLV